MAKVQQSSIPAYEVIYDRYHESIWNFLRLKIRSEERALELTQDVLVKIYHSAHLFKLDQKFRPWLWAMVRNVIRDEYKNKDALSSGMQQTSDEDLDIEDENSVSALDQMLAKSNSDEVEKCLNNLSESQKEAIMLQTFSELSMQEIADEMKIKVGAVKSLIFRAKDALRNCLEKCLS